MKVQNININNIRKNRIDSLQNKSITNYNNQNNNKITSLTNLYYPISFNAKEKKNIPSAEEIAKRKALEFAAIAQRKNMPEFLQMLYPLPVSSGIKAKHVNEVNKKILIDETFDKYPKLKESIEHFILGKDSNGLVKKEKDALNKILYSKDRTVMLEDAPYEYLLNKAFSSTVELKDLPIEDKAFITSILKSKKIDGGELSKSVVTDYKDLILYAKNKKDKLTEPVEEILTDNQIEEYFENNKVKSIVALLTAGGHPSRQRLEQRLNKYDKTLDTINYLFHIPELRDDLITICENQNKVNPAEIITFFELSKGFLDLGKTNNELKNLINKSILPEGINIEYLSAEYLKTINNALCTDKKEIDTKKWDLNNVYTIPYFLKLDLPEHKDRFKDLFISTLNDSYYELIHNSEKEYGPANTKTAKLFESNGLSYKKWLNYNKEISFTLLTKAEYENNPQIRKELFEYIKGYANDIADKPVKIYIGNQFNKLDISDLAEPQIGKFKIIGNTNKLKSYLDAIIAKDRFERYTVIDDTKDYIMELREIK